MMSVMMMMMMMILACLDSMYTTPSKIDKGTFVHFMGKDRPWGEDRF